MSVPLTINSLSLGFYPDEGDAGGQKSYLSDLNRALSTSFPSSPTPIINVVGWYAQTYPHETFTGFQLLPLVRDIRAEYLRLNRSIPFIYEASVMPFQSWVGYTSSNNSKALEVASVMQRMLEESRIDDGEMAIGEIRLRFGHEMNYYISSGLYPPPTIPSDPGADFRSAFDQVSLAIHSLPSPYREKVKMWWCPNIASTSSGASAEYERFLPNLDRVDYVGIDYYCPAPGCNNASDFVRKMKKVHDRYASAERPFLLGETGLHYDGGMEEKLKWLGVVMGKESRRELRWMRGGSWFNYEKDRDYRLIFVRPGEEGRNRDFVEFAKGSMEREERKSEVEGKGKKRGFWKTLLTST